MEELLLLSSIPALNGEQKPQGSSLNRTVLLTLGWKLGGKIYSELILSHVSEERFTRNCDKVALQLVSARERISLT